MVCKTLRNLFLFQISKWIFSIVPILQSLVTGFTIVFEETFAFTGYLLGTVGFLLLNVSFGIFFFCGAQFLDTILRVVRAQDLGRSLDKDMISLHIKNMRWGEIYLEVTKPYYDLKFCINTGD